MSSQIVTIYFILILKIYCCCRFSWKFYSYWELACPS